jgi:uncharacterized protein (DUF305 family)
MNRRSAIPIPILFVALAAAACASKNATVAPATPAPATPSNSDIEALYRARQDSARMRFTQNDVHFMTGMIGHHAQAILMSKLIPTHTANSTMHTLGGRIINAQTDEIALMSLWLKDRKQPVPEVHIEGLTLMVHGADHAMHMPGMLTEEQLKQLDAARGAEFDRLFLNFMIQHHRGAITMVHELFNAPEQGQDEMIFKLASDIQVDQVTEVARMEKMLAAMPKNSQ